MNSWRLANFKKFIPLICLFVLLGVFVLGAGEAEAVSLVSLGRDAILGIFTVVFEAIKFIFSQIIALAAHVFDWVLTVTKFTKIDMVQTGWGITRDLVNMFFILVLLIIAIATILRQESYGIKSILPKLIAVALLINFSLMICGIIIDFTQILADFFIQKGVKGQSISAALASGLNITKTLQAAETDLTDPTLAMIFGLVGAVIIYMITAFTLFAGAILLLVRIAALWLLIIFAPLAWFCMILPQTKKYWSMWWDKFLSYAFFAPAYTFFIYLALLLVQSDVAGQLSESAPENTETVTTFFSSTGFLIQYIVVIIILLGGLAAARSMGVYGAGAVTGMVKAGMKGIGKLSLKGVKYSGRQALIKAAKLGTEGARIPLTKRRIGPIKALVPIAEKVQRRAEARESRAKLAREERKKRYSSLVGAMSDEDLIKEAREAKGIKKNIAAKERLRRGLYRNYDETIGIDKDRKEIQEIMGLFKGRGLHDQLRELENIRPDTIEDGAYQEEVIERAKVEGTHNKWGTGAGSDVETIYKLGQQLGPTGAFASYFQGLTTKVKKEFEGTMFNYFHPTNNFEDQTEEGKKVQFLRKRYARGSGKIYDAYKDTDNQIDWTKPNSDQVKAFTDYARGLRSSHINDLLGKEDREALGRKITVAQVNMCRQEPSSNAKNDITDGAELANNTEALAAMAKSDFWNYTKRKIKHA